MCSDSTYVEYNVVHAQEMVTRPPWLRPWWPPRTGPCCEAPCDGVSSCCSLLRLDVGLLSCCSATLGVHVYIEAAGSWSKLNLAWNSHHLTLQLIVDISFAMVYRSDNLCRQVEALSFSPYIICFIRSNHLSKFMIFLPLRFICLSCHWSLAAIYLLLTICSKL